MKGRYELRHPRYGRGYRYTNLAQAQRELAHSVPAGEWVVYDRLDKCEVSK